MNYRLKHYKKKTSTASTDYHSWTQAHSDVNVNKTKATAWSSAPDQTLLLSDNPSYDIQTHLYEEMNGKRAHFNLQHDRRINATDSNTVYLSELYVQSWTITSWLLHGFLVLQSLLGV